MRGVRPPALFCPECGSALTLPEAKRDNSEGAAEPVADPPEPAPAEPETPPKRRTTAKAAGIMRQGGERTRQTLHRASNVARGAIEDNVKRVEKIHHVSTVMIEEATYDPSLRFVLVALGLFVVFVVLLVLSKVMG